MLGRVMRLAAGANLVALVMVFGLAGVTEAAPPATVDVWGGNASAAGVHEVGYTAAFPNFTTGAVDNHYPLAVAGQDAAPSSHAAASNADYGPFAATVFAGDPPGICPGPACPPHNPPPAVYARASFPGPTHDSTYSAHSQGACTASSQDCSEAHAQELQASSAGTYSGDGAPTQQGTAVFKNATADTKTILMADGSTHVHTHSHVGTATFGGDSGLVIKDVDVTCDVVSVGGVAKVTETIRPGSATLAGQPVDVTDHPTTVTTPAGPQTITPPGGTQVVTPALTIQVFTVQPVSHTNGNRGDVYATGTHVVVSTAGATVGGVPANRTEYILGEAYADGYVTPALPPPAVTADLSSFPGGNDLSNSSSTTTTTTTIVSGPSTVTAPSTIISKPALRATKKARVALAGVVRPNLALPFFLWEALVLAAASSIVWARRRKNEDEV
jgi:hypothetical protein